MNFSPYTFGSEKACVILADLLIQEKNQAYSRRIAKTLNHFNQVSEEIILSPKMAKKHKIQLLEIWLEHYFSYFALSDYPEKIRTYSQNVLKIRYRKYKKMLN